MRGSRSCRWLGLGLGLSSDSGGHSYRFRAVDARMPVADIAIWALAVVLTFRTRRTPAAQARATRRARAARARRGLARRLCRRVRLP